MPWFSISFSEAQILSCFSRGSSSCGEMECKHHFCLWKSTLQMQLQLIQMVLAKDALYCLVSEHLNWGFIHQLLCGQWTCPFGSQNHPPPPSPLSWPLGLFANLNPCTTTFSSVDLFTLALKMGCCSNPAPHQHHLYLEKTHGKFVWAVAQMGGGVHTPAQRHCCFFSSVFPWGLTLP